MKYPRHISRLIGLLKLLPGVGAKTAERFAFHLIDLPESKLKEMGEAIATTSENVHRCKDCGCLISDQECQFCDVERRSTSIMCVVSSPKDALTLEMTNQYKGLYHVLGGVLSPLEGKGPDSLKIPELMQRIRQYEPQEIVLALDSTLEGDATALYLTEQLRNTPIQVTRLASGLPMGSTLDYVDGGTLAYALTARSKFSLYP